MGHKNINGYSPTAQERIRVHAVVEKETIKNSLNHLSREFFEVFFYNSLKEIYKQTDEESGCLIVVEGALYTYLDNNVEENGNALLVVTNESFDLKDKVFNLIPEALFNSEYLEEFIHWGLQKSAMIYQLNKKMSNHREIERLINDLTEVSRCSITNEN